MGMRRAPELLRPGHAQQPPGGHRPAELLRHLEVAGIVGERPEKVRWDVLLHQLAQLAPQALGVGAQVVVQVHDDQ